MTETDNRSTHNGKGGGDHSTISNAENQPKPKQQSADEPEMDETCESCHEKECWGTTGSHNRSQHHSQKVPSRWIECDMCKSWCHGTCQQLLVIEVNVIIKLAGKGVKWYCDTCLPTYDGANIATNTAQMKKIHNLERMMTNVGGKIELYQKQTTDQVSKMRRS